MELRRWITGVFILMCFTGMTGLVPADHNEDHKEKDRDRHQKSSHKKESAKKGYRASSPENSAYQDTCGGCHFAYQPFLLPSASWNRIMESLDDHFGENIDIDPEHAESIRKYLASYAADHSRSEISSKIMKSLAGKIVLRITEVPYIIRKHKDNDIPSDAFQRKSVGSMGNCIACHTTAKQGIFDDDGVRIPK